MNRTIQYSQEVLRSFDFLWSYKDAMYGLSRLTQDAFGQSNTVVAGLAAAATAPTSLNVTLASGSIYQLSAADSNAYGALPADDTVIFQQGMAAAQSVSLTTNGLAAGQSQWALIQASFSQVDAVRVGDPTSGVTQFWNANNTADPLEGEGGNDEPLNTVRQGVCSISVIYGPVATTGSEVPPSPSAGCVPLYLVDLAYGQTTISQGQILTAAPSVSANVPNNYPQAPFLAGLLNSHHGGTLGQAPKIMMAELASASSANSGGGISTVYTYAGNPNGHVAGVAASNGLPPDFCVDTTDLIFYFCSTTGNAASAVWNPASGQSVNFAGGTSMGTANAQVVSTVTPGGFALVNGYSVTFTPGLTSTGAATLAVAGTAATACRKNSGGSLVAFSGGEWVANEPITMTFNGTFWVLQTGVLGAVAYLNLGAYTENDGAGNLTLKLNSSTLGNDGSDNLTVSTSSGIQTTGDIKWRPTQETLAGYVMANATTIGNATSEATQLASAAALALYEWHWTNFSNTQCPVTGGRGSTALADFNASKAIQVLDLRGKAMLGMDTMDGSATTLLSGVPVTSGNATTAGSVLGENLHALIIAELAAHNHGVTDPGHGHATSDGTGLLSNGPTSHGWAQGTSDTLPIGTTSIASNTTSISIQNAGSGTAHNNVGLAMTGTLYIKL